MFLFLHSGFSASGEPLSIVSNYHIFIVSSSLQHQKMFVWLNVLLDSCLVLTLYLFAFKFFICPMFLWSFFYFRPSYTGQKWVLPCKPVLHVCCPPSPGDAPCHLGLEWCHASTPLPSFTRNLETGRAALSPRAQDVSRNISLPPCFSLPTQHVFLSFSHLFNELYKTIQQLEGMAGNQNFLKHIDKSCIKCFWKCQSCSCRLHSCAQHTSYHNQRKHSRVFGRAFLYQA